MASTAIPALQTLDIGSIQDLMTLGLHTLAPMASIYSSANLNVHSLAILLFVFSSVNYFLLLSKTLHIWCRPRRCYSGRRGNDFFAFGPCCI